MDVLKLIVLYLAESLFVSLVLGTCLYFILRGIMGYRYVKWWMIFVGFWICQTIFEQSIKPLSYPDIKAYQSFFALIFISGIVGAYKARQKKVIS